MWILAAILLIGFFGGICWSLWRGSVQFVIRLARGAVRFSGKFPRSRQSDVAEFLKREFADRGRITISALKAPSNRVRLVIRGRITDGERQRIRNYFQTFC
ncbi:MAG: hypothetical protein ACM3U2_21395 [Deltaproteobacteria bacterium]